MTVENEKKLTLGIYAAVTVTAFIYCLMPAYAAAGRLVFALVQLACFCYFVFRFRLENRRALLWFVPILVMAFHSFASAGRVWIFSNTVVSAALYLLMCTRLCGSRLLRQDSPLFVGELFQWFGRAIQNSFRWCGWIGGLFRGKKKLAGKIGLGLFCGAVCAFVLLCILSMADLVLANLLIDLLEWIIRWINFSLLIKLAAGAASGLFLFGMAVTLFFPKKRENDAEMTVPRAPDATIYTIISIFLCVVYAVFIFLQFRYLFARAELPVGMSYTEYARHGFFELAFLSAVNVLYIIIGVRRYGRQWRSWGTAVKAVCLFLCAATCVMLVSSFYRMTLYTNDDGLTWLRLLVFGFLIFEGIGLAATALYIIRPRFNIIAVYAAVALAYYMVINCANIDGIVAKNQIDRYFAGDDGGVDYVLTLSADAGVQVARLRDDPRTDEKTRQRAAEFIAYGRGWKNMQLRQIPRRWQRISLSDLRMQELAKK